MKERELIIIGGGPAGLAAAISAHDNGVKDILLIEREDELGGILNQCIHNGFGLHTFKEELTGPEYANKYIDMFFSRNISYKLNTIVLDISKEKVVSYISEDGFEKVKAKSIILAMGCRERPRGALNIPGTRPSGVFSAGTAQRLINIDGIMPGREVVILGSGDIGLIMARRMTLEGAKVKAVLEIMPYSNGLNRNIEQCLKDFDIPLKLSHTITKINGRGRVSSVEISKVDENLKPIIGTEEVINCDTVLLSVGLIPENELVRNLGIEFDSKTRGAVVDNNLMTNVEGIFSCGNVLHVHDLVDFVSDEAKKCGISASKYIRGELKEGRLIEVYPKNGISYVVPKFINEKTKDELIFRFRVNNIYSDKNIVVYFDGEEVYKKRIRKIIPSEMETLNLKNYGDLSKVSKIEVMLGEI